MKAVSKLLIAILALSTIASCARHGADDASKEPQPGGGMGTSVGGGGGNGIDGKPIESYSIRIEKLPEYRLYVSPVLKKISRGGGDVLAAYLQWAAGQKAWYSVPRELEFVSKQRTGLWMSTEQLAIQSDREIFLHTPKYQSMKPQERASLLLHEMVMAARFLMKKSPQEQCEALSRGGSKACSDPEVVKLAKVLPYDPEAAKIMDEDDHAAVRTLTRYLSNSTDDVTPEGVAELRRSLRFVFPWDQVVSRLELSDVDAALRRESARGSVFKSVPATRKDASGKIVETECLYTSQYYEFGGLNMAYFEALPAGAPVAPETYELQIEWGGHSTMRRSFYFKDSNLGYGFLDVEHIQSKGALNPNDPNEIVDHVTTTFEPTKETADKSTIPVFEFWLSRENPARVVEYRTSFSRIVFRDLNDRSEWDLVPAPDQPTRRCVLKR